MYQYTYLLFVCEYGVHGANRPSRNSPVRLPVHDPELDANNKQQKFRVLWKLMEGVFGEYRVSLRKRQVSSRLEPLWCSTWSKFAVEMFATLPAAQDRARIIAKLREVNDDQSEY